MCALESDDSEDGTVVQQTHSLPLALASIQVLVQVPSAALPVPLFAYDLRKQLRMCQMEDVRFLCLCPCVTLLTHTGQIFKFLFESQIYGEKKIHKERSLIR